MHAFYPTLQELAVNFILKKPLSKELSNNGITFNSILTGGVLTDRTKNLLQMEADAKSISIEKMYMIAAENIPVGLYL